MIPDSSGFAALANRFAGGDRSTALALLAVVRAAGPTGTATFHDVATRFREDYLAQLRAEGRDAEREAGRLSLDEVHNHLGTAVLPRLAASGALQLPSDGLRAPDQIITIDPALWSEIQAHRLEFAAVLRRTGDHAVVPPPTPEAAPVPDGEVTSKQGD